MYAAEDEDLEDAAGEDDDGFPYRPREGAEAPKAEPPLLGPAAPRDDNELNAGVRPRRRPRPPDPRVPPVIQWALRKLHEEMGHARRGGMIRLLVHGGGSPEALRYAREFRCTV